MNRKLVLIDGDVLCQKALSLYKDSSKRFSETSDTKPFIPSKDGYTNSGIDLAVYHLLYNHKKEGEYSTIRYLRDHIFVTCYSIFHNYFYNL